MKAATLFMLGLLIGCCLNRRRRLDVSLETEELATPGLFRRTVKLRYRPPDPVSKGVAPTPG